MEPITEGVKEGRYKPPHATLFFEWEKEIHKTMGILESIIHLKRFIRYGNKIPKRQWITHKLKNGDFEIVIREIKKLNKIFNTYENRHIK